MDDSRRPSTGSTFDEHLARVAARLRSDDAKPPDPDDHLETAIVRKAIEDARDVRTKNVAVPPTTLDLILQIVIDVARITNKTTDEILASYDPDPRLCRDKSTCRSWEETIADLDELERARAVLTRRNLMRAAAKMIESEPAYERTIWCIAHDSAVLDVNRARARTLFKGEEPKDAWHAGTFKDTRHA